MFVRVSAVFINIYATDYVKALLVETMRQTTSSTEYIYNGCDWLRASGSSMTRFVLR